ncbi:hypothetical protein ACFOZ7_08325 [Natribaculum luteum]|uniref:DUF7124 domain-containing protein n=1 Tax=Natribaculum luteum TaxID=1586232 RepID=A0ABD5NYA1_9EURY|nr:hypothetical protein [Natribaculum luteum]
MTDSIDLDDLDVEDEEDEANYGDWIWRGEGDPADEPASPWADDRRSTDDVDPAGRADQDDRPEAGPTGERTSTPAVDDPANAEDAETATDSAGGANADRKAAPRVPRTSRGPVGIPKDAGGAGGTGGGSRTPSSGAKPDASGPHGGDADEMTMALTYDAIRGVEDPRYVIASAREWADWIGIVGEVSTPTIQKFQRDVGIDVDFFGGSATGPAERLADVDRRSMFYAERMVVVGPEDDAWIAKAADWEFVPLEEAAEKAGWELE